MLQCAMLRGVPRSTVTIIDAVKGGLTFLATGKEARKRGGARSSVCVDQTGPHVPTSLDRHLETAPIAAGRCPYLWVTEARSLVPL